VRDVSVLVVDDSAYNRRTISDLLETIPGVRVAGKASDGNEALRQVAELEPDLVTLDLEMPRMDGFTFLRLLMARRPTPVIVVSGYSAKENVFRALELGALDFVAKPTRSVTSDLAQIRSELLEKVALVRHLQPSRLRKPSTGTGPFAKARAAERPARRPLTKVLLIGASTGGPTALVEIFRRFPPGAQIAAVVAQHMPERFTRTFAERLDRLGGLRVEEASGAHRLEAGRAWVCPGGRCVEIGADGQLVVVQPSPNDRYVPSVDRLFETGARRLGERAYGVVLTGMGDDGAQGVLSLRDVGATVLAEAAETAVIYGMPGAAVRAGGVSESLPIESIASRLAKLA